MNNNNMIGRNVLITGGAGFIGSHLADHLISCGNHILSIDNLVNGSLKNIEQHNGTENFKFFKIDLLDFSKLEAFFSDNKIDVVFHLAANSNIQLGSEDLEVDLKNTFMTTFNILRCMKKFNLKELVFASSSAIYGESEGKLSEDYGPLFPISFYGSAKLASEAYVSAFCENFEIKAWIIRFPNVVGERLTHGVIYDFINKLSKNPSALHILGDGKQTKPYLYVKDLIDAICFTYKKSKEKINYYNISADSTTSVERIAEIVIKVMNLKNVTLEYKGSDRGWVGDVPMFSYNTTKVKSLGWAPRMSSDAAVKLAVERELIHRGLVN
jgi:UDP-glucose 4-epimerase